MRSLLNISRHSPKCLGNLRLLPGIPLFQPISTKVIQKLEDGFDMLASKFSNSLLKKHLNDVIIDKLKDLKTPTYKSNLLDCIASGYANLDSRIGVYAPDPEAYEVFAKMFDPIIEDFHGFKKRHEHPKMEFGPATEFKDIDQYNRFILSTRIRVDRNLDGYPFIPRMTKAEFIAMEKDVHYTFRTLMGRLKGEYYPLRDMFRSAQLKLMENHRFKDPDRFMDAANFCRFRPTGRGYFYSYDKRFMVWFNFEDHLRIISMQQGANFGQVYSRLIEGIKAIERELPFLEDNRLGFLTCCPSKLGTAMRASVLIKLVKLPAETEMFQEVLDQFNLQVRGTYGEHSDVINGVYDISNRTGLGLTEYEIVKSVYEGIGEIIRLEKGIRGGCCCYLFTQKKCRG